MQYLAWACVAGSSPGLEADRGNFADFRGVVVVHAVREEGGVPGVGCFDLVPYGLPINGPCRTDGPSGEEVGQPPGATHALVTARVAGWRAVVGCVWCSAAKPMEAFKTPVR